jgi:hypothetical protein
VTPEQVLAVEKIYDVSLIEEAPRADGCLRLEAEKINNYGRSR